jgi:hypothetical protein
MLACPVIFKIPIARFRRVAMTWGPLPVRVGEASSPSDVADMMQRLDPPVAADPGGELGRAAWWASRLVMA